MLGLQDAYALLHALDDPTGRRFADRGLGTRESPLNARNRSILAHGFDVVSKDTYRRLRDDALHLADLTEADLPAALKIGANVGG